MATTWPPERRAEVEEALRSSRTRADAAARMGITTSSLDRACAKYGLRPEALLAWRPVRDSGTAQEPKPHVEVHAEPVASPDAPAWQGYRPRAGWSAPEAGRPAKPAKVEVIRSVVTADWHKPYTDRKAWACALGVQRDLKPHRIIMNGDGLEMESVSRHPKSRPDLTRLSEEYYAGNVALDEWQETAPNAEAYFVEGNHEGRVARFAAEYGELDGMLSVPASLYMEPRGDYHRETSQLRGVRWIPLRMQPFGIGAVGYLHGVFESLYHAAMTAQHLGPKHGFRHLVTAHMHGWQSFASPSGHRAYSCPWLGDETAHTIRAYVKGKPRPWHLGLLYVEEAGESVSVTPIFIENGRALVGGHIVQAAA